MNSKQNMPHKLPDSLWVASACAAPETTTLQGDQFASVVVIGGGFTGLSTALHLAEKGVSVTVLEATEIGYGGSGRNVGLVNAGLWLNPSDIDAKVGKKYGDRLDATLAKAPDLVFSLIDRFNIECEATRHGTLQLSHSRYGDRYLQHRAAELTQRGAPVEIYQRDKTIALTGTQAYRTSLFDPRAGTIQPLGYVRGLAKAALSLGAKIHTDTAVSEIQSMPSGEWKVSTSSGSVTAEKVVLATNAYGQGLNNGLDKTFIPLHFFQFATAPLNRNTLKHILPEKHGTWDTRQVMSFIRLDQAGRLIVGSIGRVEDSGCQFLKDWASDYLCKLFPDFFSQQEIHQHHQFWQHGWSGKIAFANDHMPHLHTLAPGMITCIGYSGRGIAPGTIMGKELADHLTGMPIEEMSLPCRQPKSIFARQTRRQYYARGSDLYHLYQRAI
ncbi:FAD-dependent oxidoreductase [Amphritea sp. 1_MG-2023]|uniref:NAD(P)/FAD-dependent oxidoreductase n=1 Tax=Amphritea sp. 1_MG-2023 TaxID=3062670 RepID=UPI0026E3EE81|nr:FAD-dependent oxidoreductase [Amphritea sp. 1_MG-2023]MDO6564334.1 FAD-dependent oxidoreductase [Amphritea sp. 1_MG-2023]